MAGYIVNGLMENRHQLLLRINIESFRGLASEMEGASDLLDTFHEKDALRIQTVGTDTGYFAKPFLTALFRRRIQRTLQPRPPDGMLCISGSDG